ncbi:ExbD/TolR family protein [Emticicia soli]|uniref:ExbD/TolR family protein n=1 Tax=Emticicia soli TaxID=2027878 RepID=A0ABW5JCT4_9BACT
MAEIQESGGGGKKGGGKVRSKKAGGKPDMTPMVDLGFLLITFFMYTTTFGKPNMMKLNMPDKPDPNDPPPPEVKVTNTVTVLMGKDDRIFWYQKPLPELTVADLNETDYSAEGIRKAILVKKANALDVNKFTVIIKPSDEANWKNTVDILDEMAITKSDRYAIVDLAPKEKEMLDQKLAEPKK